MPVSTSLDHVTVTTDDFETSRPVYDAVMAALGFTATVDYIDPEEDDDDTGTVAAIGYGPDGGRVCVLLVSGEPATAGAHWALAAADRSAVQAAAGAASSVGARVKQQPREWESRQLGYYGTQIVDPAGNVIEILYRG